MPSESFSRHWPSGPHGVPPPKERGADTEQWRIAAWNQDETTESEGDREEKRPFFHRFMRFVHPKWPKMGVEMDRMVAYLSESRRSSRWYNSVMLMVRRRRGQVVKHLERSRVGCLGRS